MSKTNLNFGNIEVKKIAFHNSKYPINIEKVDIKKILMSNRVSHGKKVFKYFIYYKYDDN